MEQSPPWEASQEIPRLLLNPKVHYRVRNGPPLVTNRPNPTACVTFRNKLLFYGDELSASHPTPELEDHPLSAVRECLFNIFSAILYTR
jgi:hypothetical protein